VALIATLRAKSQIKPCFIKRGFLLRRNLFVQKFSVEE
jgi:hypothetical protein